MKMTLKELEFIRLLPLFMRGDLSVRGMANGLDDLIPRLSESFKLISTWDQIDNLSEAELDELAWELNILWYDPDAEVEVKRDLVKNSDKVYQHLGTKWAVESVVESYFGSGEVREWFDYGGLAGRFRIHSTNPSITGERLLAFLNLINKVKRASAKLEAIQIDLESTAHMIYGIVGEMAGRIDVWPKTAREITTEGSAAVSSVLSCNAKLDIYPRSACAIATGCAASVTGAPVYNSTLEIYPQGGESQ